MSLPPARRSAADAHARARTLAAMRVDAPLDARSSDWLDAHLAGCEACRAAADGYEADQALLRGVALPQPPRDLWARTAAQLDREAGGARRTRAGVGLRGVPMGALAGALVVAVVLGASFLTDRGTVPAASPFASPGAAAASGTTGPLTARATPIPVDRHVGLVHAGRDGTLGVFSATVDEVCAAGSSGQCEADTNGSAGGIALSEQPKSVVQSPNGKQLAVVTSAAHGGSVVIVAAPTPAASASPSAPAPSASLAPSATVGPTGTPSARPSTSPTPKGSPSSSPGTSATPTPSPTPSPTGTPAASSTPTDAPISIAADVTVIGQSAAYSATGAWFAFSARPADGSFGPDIYVWHTGDAKARRVTNDHHSVFSAWIGENVLGSRAEPIAASASGGATLSDAAASTPSTSSATGLTTPGIEARSVSFLLDPVSGASRTVAGDGIWRPVLDPTGSFAVYWSGTIAVDPNGLDWRPANGTLVLARWDPTQLVAPVSPSPSAAASPTSPIPSASPAAPVALLAAGPVGDWDARWDESGTYLGVWVSDRTGSQTGKLTLHTVDLATGALDAAGAVLTDQAGQPGFSLRQGRLAWVAPDGVTGSVVKVYAWAGAKGGTAQTTVQPGDTLVIH